MNWRSIRLELGCTDEFPAGSVSRAYLLRLPLDDDDTVDQAAVGKGPGRATVRRYWSTEPDERGILIPSGDDWAIHCAGTPDRVIHLGGAPLRLGQRVRVRNPDGTLLPFNVASIR